MKKILLLSIIIASVLNSAYAQKNAIAAYVELGGAGLASANFDMRLQKKNDGLGFRAGIGALSVRSDFGSSSEKITLTTIPLELNYLLGKDQKNYFEMGIGATIISINDRSTGSYGSSNDRFRSTFGHLYFGYRLQPKDGGFLFRAGLTPVFGNGFFVPYWAGVSFGYKF
jgi:hypothetical protein